MLFMVIERFANGDPARVGKRFQERGRLLPDGVDYVTSWLTLDGAICYQVMEAADASLIETWTRQWDDLASFEIDPVQTSADFWATFTPRLAPVVTPSGVEGQP